MVKQLAAALLLLCASATAHVAAQCSSLYTTPEFPVATHPSDQHTQSWGTNIFTPAQMGGAAGFTGIQIYVDNSFGPTTYANQTVWMRHTAVSSYPNANYPTTAGFTQCFSGTYSFPMSGLYTISFNVAPFAYNGSQNVEILFENRSNVYRVNEPWFRRTTSYGASVYRSKWNGNFGFGGFPGTASDGSAVRLTYTLSLTAVGGGGCGAVLPRNTTDFMATAQPTGEVACAWQLLEGLPGGSLVLERSLGDTAFVPVHAWEAPTAGAYAWTDAAPGTGVNLYRLRAVDAGGGASLSEMVLVDRRPVAGLVCYALPSPDGLDLMVQTLESGPATVTVTDMAGRLLQKLETGLEAGMNHVRFPLPDGSGVLLVHVATAKEAWTGRTARL